MNRTMMTASQQHLHIEIKTIWSQNASNVIKFFMLDHNNTSINSFQIEIKCSDTQPIHIRSKNCSFSVKMPSRTSKHMPCHGSKSNDWWMIWISASGPSVKLNGRAVTHGNDQCFGKDFEPPGISKIVFPQADTMSEKVRQVSGKIFVYNLE